MLIAGWAIRRRRLAADGPAHRGHVLLIRVAPGWRWPPCCSPGPSCPRPSSNCQSGADWACKAAGSPASNSPRWSSACRCSMPPISPTSCAPRCARCRRGWSRPDRRWRYRAWISCARRRAQRRARGAAALRQPVPGADQEQHAGHRHRLPGPDGRHQHRHHADRPGAGRHLAGAGGYLGLALALGGALSAWNARSARHGPGDLHGARLGERPAAATLAGQGGGRWARRLARTAALLAALLAAGSLADWALLNAIWRGDAAACAQAAGAC